MTYENMKGITNNELKNISYKFGSYQTQKISQELPKIWFIVHVNEKKKMWKKFVI